MRSGSEVGLPGLLHLDRAWHLQVAAHVDPGRSNDVLRWKGHRYVGQLGTLAVKNLVVLPVWTTARVMLSETVKDVLLVLLALLRGWRSLPPGCCVWHGNAWAPRTVDRRVLIELIGGVVVLEHNIAGHIRVTEAIFKLIRDAVRDWHLAERRE